MPRVMLCGTFFFEVANRFFFSFKLVFAPSREEIEPSLVGMSLTTLGEVPRPVSRFSIVTAARISDYYAGP